ncbi:MULTISPECIES: TonB-dependent receptor [unclassified Novosphingobium]|uniref:TonB-dependent receptor n=1 Tax=unclassified Novosphingobium TaxID=2644732 RepID=UPI000AD55468|nr:MULTISPECIES: TonB-dependent receptor [unclassified Novosphingobium]MBN9143340.1 TonB-dependent receptor [Novosphingobium sp.]MDR6706431.1 iron complex outermembrane receptor protein [Novosphingobium sp. 1748]NKJ01288.1 iron complex outermembrane receptor protein [Novosphingobium sp. SG707]
MNRGLAAALCASVSLFAMPAHAADQAPAGDSAKTGGLSEIVVTASRVETTSQKTPIALTVYSGADLAAKGVTNMQALSSIDASLNITTSTGAAYVAVRGIASTDVTETGDPSVPIARDGFYTNRSFNIQSSMYDVARVEVLKGPQGTLNGRNSTGGLVSIITNRPNAKTGGYVTLGTGNYNAFDADAGVNIAVSDRFQVRASGTYHSHDGYRNLTGLYNGAALRGDDQKVGSGRFQAAWKPVDGLKLWASYQHDEVDNVGDVTMDSAIGVRPDFGNAKSFANTAPSSTKLTGDRVRWEAVYDALPAGLSLIYSGGYDKSSFRRHTDATGPVYPAVRQFIQGEDPTTWNHEVRLSNNANSRVFFQLGWFNFKETNVINSGLYNVQMTGLFAPGGPLSALGQPGVYGIKFDYNIATKSNAVFGQIAYRVNDQIKITLGARNTWDSKFRTGNAVLFLPALGSPFAPGLTLTTPGNGNMSTSQPTYHIGVDYQVTPTSLLYAKFDTGYKAGGFNSNGSAASVAYAPEKLSAWEIGSKNRFFGNNLQVNAAAFYFDYRGYQASRSTDALSGGSGIFNVGSAKIMGAELQTVALVQGFRLDSNIALLHTEFGKGITVLDGAGNNRDISGHRLPNAPDFVATFGVERPIEAGFGTFTPRIDGKYSAAFYYDVFNDADTRSGAYVTGNASINFKPAKGNWQIDAFIRNFTDKVVLAYGARNYVAGKNTYQFQPPRTFGVRASLKF